MLRNYFLTAVRNILRHKAFSVIIVIGLTIGVAVFGLVLTYVNSEFSYDRFNEHFESVYRLEYTDWALGGTAYGPEIAQQFPEVVSAARVSVIEGDQVTLKVGERKLQLDHMIYADSGFFNIFSFEFIKGNPKRSLDDPSAIILTESTARKIFGNEDPMNKSFQVNNNLVYTVTGIIRDVSRFHLRVNAVASFISLKDQYGQPDFLHKYDTWNYYTYFRLEPQADAKRLSQKINDFYTGRISWIDERPEFSLRPLKELYYTHVKNDIPMTKANRPMLRIYILVAVFILIIACVNYINLAIARATTRSREIGIRKVVGAKSRNLIIQYIGETVLYALIATELSLVLMEILRPAFNNLVQRQLTLLSLGWGWILFLVLAIPLLIGILSGLYPAVYLTRFNALITMKNEKTRGKGSLFFRRALIIVQFVISVVLIIGTFTVHKQLAFIKNADLGYSKENVLLLPMNNSLNEHLPLLWEMLLENPDIKGVSRSTQSLDNISWQESIEVGADYKPYTYLGMDTSFIPLMGLEITEGRNFQGGLQSDYEKVIINKAAVGYFGLSSPSVGQYIGTGDRRFEVLGVVKDFHFHSLRSPIGPLVMGLREDWLSTVNIKISNRNLKETIQYLEAVWNKICPDFLFGYSFLDANYEQLYKDETRLGSIFIYLAVMAIFIACIGLLGLSSFLAEQRIKEIGIRKALGDTTAGVCGLYSREFGKWVIISGFIAVPLAYLVMNKWLGTFAYRVHMDVWIMAGSCLLALVIALITVYAQTYRIASRNPVEALRYE